MALAGASLANPVGSLANAVALVVVIAADDGEHHHADHREAGEDHRGADYYCCRHRCLPPKSGAKTESKPVST